MPSPWLAVGAETDPLVRARQLQRSWERLLGDASLGAELPRQATAGLRPTIVESWRRSLAGGLDPTELLAPIEVDQPEVQERWLEHPLGSAAHVLAAQLRVVAEETNGLVVVTDASGLLLHIDGAEWLKDRAREMNLLEGARYSETADGTNGIGTALAADHPLQVFAFEHFNQRHHHWVCSGAPVHDPVSGRIVGLIDLSSLWKSAHPRSLELVATAARAMERCLLDTRRDQDARLRRRYSDLMTRSTDMLVNGDGYVLDGDEPTRATPLDVPDGGGDVVLDDGSVAVAEPLGQGEAYLVRRPGSRGSKTAGTEAIERAEVRAHELAAEQAALRRVATLVARESSPDHLFAVVANQVARVFDVPLVRVVRYEPDCSVVVGGFSERSDDPFPIGSRWALDSPGVITSVRQSGRPARVQDYAHMAGQTAATVRRSGMRSAVASPIAVEGRLWGAMVIASPRTEPLPEDAEPRLTDFTELIAAAIANAESRAAVGRLAEEQAALRRVATLVAHGASPEETFSAVSDEVGRLFGAEVALARFEPDGSGMVVVGLTQGVPVVSIGTRWELEDFLASTAVYRTGRPARSDHTGHRDASGPIADSLRQMNFVSTVAAPITVEGSLWGVITVNDRRKPLPPDTEERVGKFTELVATAIANTESRAELGELLAEQAALGRVATLVARGVSPDEILKAVSVEVGRLFGAEAGIARFEADGAGLVFAGLSEGIRGISVGTRWELEDFLACTEVYRTGRPARSESRGWQSASGPIADVLRQNDPVSMVAAPIVVEDNLWGAITVADTRGSLPSNAEERVAKFTEVVAIAIANAESRTELAASQARAHDLAREQAALRRVATLVAEGAGANELFSTVAQEVADVLGIPVVGVQRFEADRTFTMMGIAGETSFAVGSRWPVEDKGLAAMILASGRPARKADYTMMPGRLGAAMRDDRMVSTVGVPIVVQGSIWGLMVGAARPGKPIPNGTEERLARFTELVATAIANTQAREQLAELVDEQAALRRVATLVARGVSPEEVFSAVTNEMARLFGSPQAYVGRFAPDGSGMVIVGVSEGIRGIAIGTLWELEDYMASTRVYRTGRPARVERSSFEGASGRMADLLREIGAVSNIAAPIVVEGHLWGFVTVTDMHRRLPVDAEERLEKFTELLATAIANAESRAELGASRARIVAAADDARRRIERNLHDGAQQRLVTLAVALRRAEAKLPDELDEPRAEVTRVAEGLATAIDDLRELSRGIHPSILTEGGLSPALKALGRRSSIRVKLDVGFEHRLPDQVEVATYYTVSEALTNASKHSGATRVWISLRVEDDLLHLSIRDDGAGGADASRGSGLTGLTDRIEALGGTIQIESPLGGGTRIEVEIPIAESTERRSEPSERRWPAPTPASPR